MNGIHDFCATRQEEGNTHWLLSDYLSEVSLLIDQDSDRDADLPKVTLMTIHSAKGLEFRNVFVVGLEENLFPGASAASSYKELEEERRLFYVALTRAEDHCFLSYAKTRFKYGKSEFCTPSRFLKDIDSRYLNMPQEEMLARQIEERGERFRRENTQRPVVRMERDYGYRERMVTDNGPSMFDGGEIPQEPRRFVKPAPPRNLRKITPAVSSSAGQASSVQGLAVGQVIEHERFGIGDVINVEGIGDNCKATVHFRNVGNKQLLLKFARFKVIG